MLQGVAICVQKWPEAAEMIKPKATTPRVGGDIEWFVYLSCVARFASPSCHQCAGEVGQCWDEACVSRVCSLACLCMPVGLFWLFLFGPCVGSAGRGCWHLRRMRTEEATTD